jgi:hypothetical protein
MIICLYFLVLKMVDIMVMYDGFSKKSGHPAESVRIIKEFLNKSFADSRRVAKCPCIICRNYKFLNQIWSRFTFIKKDLCQTI